MEQGEHNYNLISIEEDWNEKVKKQDNDLIAWLDEFLDSDEYAEILQKRTHDFYSNLRMQKENRRFRILEKLGLNSSRTSSKLNVLERKIQKSLTKLNVENTIINQQRGIDIIRQKILECHYQHIERMEQKKMKLYTEKRKALYFLYQKFSLSDEEVSSAVINKILKQREDRKKREKRLMRNKITIVSNLVRDMKIDRRIEKKAKKSSYKTRRKHISKSDINETVHYLSLVSEDFEEESQTKILDEELESLTQVDLSQEETVDDKGTNVESIKELKEKKTKKPNLVKVGKSGKKDAKAKQEQQIIPDNISVLNPRRKFLPEYNLQQLLEDFTKLSVYLKNKEQYDLANYLSDEILLPVDIGFYGNPNKIIFKNFEPGKIYKKVISIVNGNSTAKKIRFDRIIWNSDIEEEILLDVEPFGICNVLPGMNVRICLRFTPEVLNKTTDGKIVFITNRNKSPKIYQFILNVVCVPLCAAVTISPIVVSFDEMPIWRAQRLKKQGSNYKVITIDNTGLKECKVVITKMFKAESIEHEWRKIISIIQVDDNTSGDRKQLSSSTLEDPFTADIFPRNLVQQCVENVFNVFKFERNVFIVKPKSSKAIKCFFKDVEEAGYQVESYTFSIYERFVDGQLYCIGTQDVIVNCEISSHFLQCNVDILDFEVCVYGFVYQLDFEITNPCKLAHHIQICFPSIMKPYLQANIGAFAIMPHETMKIFLKFMPCQGMLANNKFYDAELCLLEFPVYIAMQTRGYEDTPPLKIDVFAAVTESRGIVISLVETMVIDYENNEYFIDLGICTTIESVYINVEVENISLVPQHFGFLNLPKYVSIAPNHGFGKLAPMQKTIVQVVISPNKMDTINSNGSLHFRLVATTLKHSGIHKKKCNNGALLKKLKSMEDYVSRSIGSTGTVLEEDIQALKTAIINNSLISISKSNSSTSRLLQTLESTEHLVNITSYELEEEKSQHSTTSTIAVESNNYMIQFKVSVIEPIVEISHQILYFPDTPCGSYSCMSVDFISRKVANFKYIATCEIKGGTDEFEIQSNYSNLHPGSKKSIWILVKPKVPLDVIKERAAALKFAKINEEARKLEEKRELEEKAKLEGQNDDHRKKKEGKSKKGQGSKASRRSKSVNIISPEDVTVDNEDYYQAEIDVWRTIESYSLENLFTCCITYKNVGINRIDRPSEQLYIKASCQVCQPSFIHDQKFQTIDFGMVVIGMSVTKVINFQNTERNKITIDVSPTNPIGPYSCGAGTKSSPIPSEFIYKYPITFRPTDDKCILEYQDASSGNTSYSFILRGIGVSPDVVFTPSFTVCRISASYGSYADCVFEIKNDCDASVNIKLQKICEMEGNIYDQSPTSDVKNMKGKKKDSKKTTKKSKFSDDLYSYEIDSLQQYFESRKEATMFHVMGNTDIENEYRIEAHSKCTVKIRFGDLQNLISNKKGKKDKKEKSASSNSDTQKSSHDKKTKKTGSESEKLDIFYIAKYNIFLGTVYLKDIIIISSYK